MMINDNVLCSRKTKFFIRFSGQFVVDKPNKTRQWRCSIMKKKPKRKQYYYMRENMTRALRNHRILYNSIELNNFAFLINNNFVFRTGLIAFSCSSPLSIEITNNLPFQGLSGSYVLSIYNHHSNARIYIYSFSFWSTYTRTVI
jgi:hypothetical protein